jgi:recombination protein RecR
MANSSLEGLIEALRLLPGVGPKTAQRMAFHLIERDRNGALEIADALKRAVELTKHCIRCNTLTEREVCETCCDQSRDTSQLCVVESPADMLMIEQTQTFRGYYFVLMGRLSPLDGIGPDDLAIHQLVARATNGAIREIILATNYTAEGEATAHYLSEVFKVRGLTVSRLARGLPAGSELEYADASTIAQALIERKSV